MQTTETEVTTAELKRAYERTGLNRIGYSFEKAVQCDLTKKCLVRMALNAQKAPAASSKKTVMASATSSPAHYWWQEL